MVALSTMTFAQEVVNSYEMSYFEEKSFDVSATEAKNGGYKYYISMYSMESGQIVLMIDDADEMATFVGNLTDALDTYTKWDSVSIANNVTDLNKEMSIKSGRYEAAFSYGSSWHFDYNVPLDFDFKHIDGGATLIIRTGEVNSSTNQYIDAKGGVFVFNSADEIRGFIESLDYKHAREYFNNKKNTETLFED
jgi:uncharacterized protein (DUF1330 family)